MSKEMITQIILILLQPLSAVTAGLFLYRLLSGKAAALFGALLYAVCPYRLFVCYLQGSVSESLAWMLLPLYVLAAVTLCRSLGAPFRHRLLLFAASSLTLAAIGGLDLMLFLILSGLTVLTALCCRNFRILPLPFAAGILCCKPLIGLIRYLFGSADAEPIPLHSIMGAGYTPGDFFRVFAYSEGRPGLGAGLLLGAVILMWTTLVQDHAPLPKPCRAALRMALFLYLLSLRIFPWDVAQRLGLWSLRLISLLDTPAVFFGLGCCALCVPCAYAFDTLWRDITKEANSVI